MIGAVMTLMHLRRLGADRDAEHLVAKADAEGRDAAVDDVADDRHGIFARRRRVARAVGQENAVGLERKDVLVFEVCAGTTVTLQPLSASWRRMLRLMP